MPFCQFQEGKPDQFDGTMECCYFEFKLGSHIASGRAVVLNAMCVTAFQVDERVPHARSHVAFTSTALNNLVKARYIQQYKVKRYIQRYKVKVSATKCVHGAGSLNCEVYKSNQYILVTT